MIAMVQAELQQEELQHRMMHSLEQFWLRVAGEVMILHNTRCYGRGGDNNAENWML